MIFPQKSWDPNRSSIFRHIKTLLYKQLGCEHDSTKFSHFTSNEQTEFQYFAPFISLILFIRKINYNPAIDRELKRTSQLNIPEAAIRSRNCLFSVFFPDSSPQSSLAKLFRKAIVSERPCRSPWRISKFSMHLHK